jgi:hypothetical protein
MPGPDPGIHQLKIISQTGSIAESSGVKRRFALLPGNGD